ncbi:MAG: hypothetical protein ABSD85_06005 [Acidimicrobiales bacterium]
MSVLLALGVVFTSLVGGCTSTAGKGQTAATIESQQAVLTGSDVVESDMFGTSVAVSGTTAVVGTSGTSYAGRAYVFSESASGWKQAAELKGSDTTAEDAFGTSVAVAGTTIVVGAYEHDGYAGRAYVFTDTAGVWKQTAELKGSDTVADDSFGWSVAISGATIVVGAVGHSDYAGRAYVFTKTPTGWTQAAELKASDSKAKQGFGTSTAISGTTIVVGAEGAGKTGAAYVFSKSLLGWTEVATLKGSDVVGGDNFGSSVGLSGTTAVVGAYGRANSAGRAYVFTDTAGTWKQLAELKGSDTIAGDYFGIAAAISGTTVVVGAYETAKQAGRAYVFKKKASGWKETDELKGSNTVKGDFLGVSAAISGTTVVIGAYGHGAHAGRAYVFDA